MAKTFNPNRVGGGTFSIVRAADGTYSLKETGFDQISSLNMIDLDAVAKTTTAAKTQTATQKTGTTTADQTKAAFLLPKQDRGDDPFTTEKMLKSATDVSKGLSDSATQTMIANQEAQEQAAGIGPVSTFDADTFDDAVGTRIKDPTENVFGRSMPSKEQFQRQGTLPGVETPQEKLKVTSANVQKGLVDPPGFTNPFKGMLGSKFQTEKGSEVTQAGKPGMLGDTGGSMDRMSGTIPSTTFGTGTASSTQAEQESAAGTLGISADPSALSTQAQQEAAALGIKSTISGTDLEADAGAVPRADIQTPAKNTFIQSASTALKGVGEFIKGGGFTGMVLRATATPRNESASTTAFNKNRFNVVTSSGSMQGRIVGNDGKYDPANNLFHGMNRSSIFGNLEKAGQKRIDRIEKTLSKKNLNPRTREVLTKRRDDFERELDGYRRDKNNHNIKSAQKKGVDTSKLNPNEMRNVAQTGNESGNTNDSGGRTKIVCTMMNESYGFGSFRNKIWMKFHKDLSPEYQKGYHKLFLPLVKIAKTNKIIKNILEHIAVHSTIDMRQSMRGKKHLLGRVYRKILLPICYWAGKK